MFVAISAHSQAKKPKIMIIPSDNWCELNGFVTKFENQGTVSSYPDYRKALKESVDLNAVVSKLGELMADRGFPVEDLGLVMKKIETNTARSNVMTSSNSGSMLAESPLDIINRTAKTDIILEINWDVKSTGPKKAVWFSLRGLDSYTSKPITASSSTGAPSFSAELSVLLEEAILVHIDKFNDGLQRHFDELFEIGREGALIVQVWGDSEVNLETEFNLKGKTAELKRIINSYWMQRNTKGKRFSQDEASENIQKFSQVRIPLYGEGLWGDEIVMDFDTFGNQLADFLKTEFGIVVKVIPRGLGEVNLIIGGK